MVVEIAADGRFDCTVVPFDLSVGLRMIGRSKRVVDVQDATYVLEELRGEAFSVIGEDFFRRTVVKHPFVYELSLLRRLILP